MALDALGIGASKNTFSHLTSRVWIQTLEKVWFQTNSLNSNLWCDFKPFLRVWFQTKSVNSHSWFDFTLFVSLSWRVWFQTKSVNSNSWCDFTLFMSLNSNQWFEIKLFFLVASWTAVPGATIRGLLLAECIDLVAQTSHHHTIVPFSKMCTGAESCTLKL